MLDQFLIVTRGGVVVFEYTDPTALGGIEGTPVQSLIQTVLIEERGGKESAVVHEHRSHGVRWRTDNKMDLVFVAVFRKALQAKLVYIPTLLEEVNRSFASMFGRRVRANPFSLCDYMAEFNLVREAVEAAHVVKPADRAQQKPKMRSFAESKKFKNTVAGSKAAAAAAKEDSTTAATASKQDTTSGGGDTYSSSSSSTDGATNGTGPVDLQARIEANKAAKRAKMAAKGKGGGPGGGGGGKGPIGRRMKGYSPKKKAGGKDKDKDKASDPSAAPAVLDYSDTSKPAERAVTQAELDAARDMAGDLDAVEYGDTDVEGPVTASGSTGVFSFFKSFTGTSVMTVEELEPVIEKMKLHLIGKNVAAEIADALCASVMNNLAGKSKGGFTGVATVVRDSMVASLTRILTPKREVDILFDIKAAQKQGRPFTTVFCGVNGVGKSTNLSKIAFWLLANKFRIMIAACDTFRAGAVEQLRTHVRKLSAYHPWGEDEPPRIALYDRGYGKDDAAVARDATKFAADEGYDVVLVDTAGRMQDNEHLMRSLTKLIKVNVPDLVLFVGEALVGTEAVDQLSKFNQALIDYSDQHNPRTIDGIVLSKFDTIDDKVGASISMTYTTGQPIVFVGTGQDYGDLKKLHVKSVVQALLQ